MEGPLAGCASQLLLGCSNIIKEWLEKIKPIKSDMPQNREVLGTAVISRTMIQPLQISFLIVKIILLDFKLFTWSLSSFTV